MKQRKAFSARALTKWLYGIAILLLIGWMLLECVADTVLYATGRLHHQIITLADTEMYTLQDLEWDGADTLTAMSGDVQMYLHPGQPVRNVWLRAEYSETASYERDLYWHLPGKGYDRRHRVWPTAGPDQSWTYEVPLLAGQGIRLDLADQSGVRICIQAIEINSRPALYSYFIPSLWQLFWLAVLPGLAACVITLIRDAANKLEQTKKGGPNA